MRVAVVGADMVLMPVEQPVRLARPMAAAARTARRTALVEKLMIVPFRLSGGPLGPRDDSSQGRCHGFHYEIIEGSRAHAPCARSTGRARTRARSRTDSRRDRGCRRHVASRSWATASAVLSKTGKRSR